MDISSTQRLTRRQQLEGLMQTQSGHGDIISETDTFVFARAAQAEELKRLSPKPRSVLILGPGDGAELSAILAKAQMPCDALSVTALEINQSRADAFLRRFPGFDVRVLDFSEGFSGFDSGGAFDLVQCGFVLNDQTEAGKRAVVSSAHAALRPGGTFLIAEILLDSYPNIPARWPSAEAEAEVNRELESYYRPYLDQLPALGHYPESEREAFRESIEKAWKDALAHKEGREAFDTRTTIEEILRESSFKNIRFAHVFNKCWLIAAERG